MKTSDTNKYGGSCPKYSGEAPTISKAGDLCVTNIGRATSAPLRIGSGHHREWVEVKWTGTGIYCP
jgi:hypothetical protein